MTNDTSILSELCGLIDTIVPVCRSSATKALYEAAKRGDIERAEELLKQNNFVNSKHNC
ncbi:MAG: hypothetical protein IJQ39_07790 [Thermoguttaceae bacterium]|nr:hypothetical protein [Thermoguttaceae bacterium]